MQYCFFGFKTSFYKKVLDRIDFQKVLAVIQINDLLATEKQLGLKHYFNEEMFLDFKSLLELGQIKLPLYAG